MKLIKVNNEYIKEIEEFKKELIEANSSWDGCSLLQEYDDIHEWINWVNSLESISYSKDEPNVVPTVQYILVENDRILGMFNLRLICSSIFKEYGGHIEYVIRPSERRKGYGVEGLKLLLGECKKFHFDEIEVTAFSSNEGALKTIQNNGGIFKEDFIYNNHSFKRYIIPLFFTVSYKRYEILKYLGKGKGGYSYLASENDKLVTLKKIHHEPCSYYNFGDKIQAEKSDYNRIQQTGVRIPKMILIDEVKEIIIKEYIDGPTIKELIDRGENIDKYISQVQEMARLCYNKNLNIDYYPTNFVVDNDLLYYIDYECNVYSDEWNLENWGLSTWKK